MKRLNSEVLKIKFCFPDAVICVLMLEAVPLNLKTLATVDELIYVNDSDDLNLIRQKNIIKESKVRLAKSRNAVDYFLEEGTVRAFTEVSPQLSFTGNLLLVKILKNHRQDLNMDQLSESFQRYHLVGIRSLFFSHLESLFTKLEGSEFREQLGEGRPISQYRLRKKVEG